MSQLKYVYTIRQHTQIAATAAPWAGFASKFNRRQTTRTSQSTRRLLRLGCPLPLPLPPTPFVSHGCLTVSFALFVFMQHSCLLVWDWLNLFLWHHVWSLRVAKRDSPFFAFGFCYSCVNWNWSIARRPITYTHRARARTPLHTTRLLMSLRAAALPATVAFSHHAYIKGSTWYTWYQSAEQKYWRHRTEDKTNKQQIWINSCSTPQIQLLQQSNARRSKVINNITAILFRILRYFLYLSGSISHAYESPFITSNHGELNTEINAQVTSYDWKSKRSWEQTL